MKLHLTIAVPTKDRPQDLTTLLTSIQKQTRRPNDIIIVDGSTESIEPITKNFPDLPIRYFRCLPPSLPKQRNVAIKELLPQTDWIGFLDDDLELVGDALEKLEQFITAQNLKDGGIGLSILNQPLSNVNWFNAFFSFGSRPGR